MIEVHWIGLWILMFGAVFGYAAIAARILRWWFDRSSLPPSEYTDADRQYRTHPVERR